MKKFLRTGKKALSVFMAVMMVLTAWVFFEPTKASAATAGSYYVVIKWTPTNAGGTSNKYYTGKSSISTSSDTNNCMGISLFYKTDNGTGTTGEVYWDIGHADVPCGQAQGSGASVTPSTGWTNSTEGTQLQCVATVPGFPTEVFAMCDYASLTKCVWQIDSIQVGASSSSLTTLWSGKIGLDSSMKQYYATINSSGVSGNPNSGNTTSSNNWSASMPSATAVKFISGETSITIPKTGASDYSTTYTAGVYDQYGVRMTYEPTYYVRSSAPTSAQTASSSITGVTMTSGTSSGTLKVTSDAQLQNTDSTTVYVHAKYNTLYANRAVTLSDPSYTFTFQNTHGGTPSPSSGSTSSKKYYNTYGSTPSGTRTGFTFLGYFRDSDVADSFAIDNTSGKTKLTSSTVYDGDYTWYAAWQANQYTATFAYKDANYADTSTSKTQYYTTALTAPSIPSPIDTGDYTYTFSSWSPTVPSTMPASNNTYTATYTQTPNYADYTEVVKQIGAAEAKMAETLYQEDAYTPASVSAFETAYDQAVASNKDKLLLSQQSQVNALAEALKTARENLTFKKYTVLFVDEDGAIIKDGYFYVDYGTKVTAPTAPAKDPDATYHYTFTGWDSTDSDDMSALDKVTDDLKFIAKFTKTAHTMTDTVTTEAGCQNDGVITHTCSVCGYSYTTAGDPAKHTWSTDYVTIAPATCSAVGKEAKQCTVCGVFDSTTVRDIPTTEHSFGAWTDVEAATCGREGVQTRTCSICGQIEVQKTAATGAHTYVTKYTSAATCTADGVTIEVCSGCGDTKITTTTKLGHDLTTTTIQEATCASVGVKETKCSRCEYSTTEIIPATGAHSYGEWTTVSEPTCISKGVQTRTCSVCGKVETQLTDETAHDWGEWKEVTPASCTGKGVEKRTCSICGQSETQEIPAAGHQYNSTVVAPTCTEKGYTLNVCTVCGGSYTTDEVEALGHDFAIDYTIDKEATCTSEGQQSRHCTRCGAVTDVQTIAKLAHDYELKTVAPTCTESGYTAYVCKNCDALDLDKDITLIDPTGHTWNDGEILAGDEATCEKAAVKTYTCTVCGETKREVEGSPLGHDWGDWFISKPATDTEKGEKTRVCNNDPTHIETCEIPTIGHNWKVVNTVDSTCAVAGYIEYECTTCENCAAAIKNGGTGATLTVALPLAEHTYTQEITTPATCTTDGSAVVKCSVCDKVFQTVTIPATGHTIVRDTASDVAPTCETDGYYAYKCTNAGCDYTETITRPAIGHNYDTNGDGKVTADDATLTKAATCTEKGVLTYTCQNDASHTYTEEIPTIAHSYVVDADASKTATCTEMGYTVMKCENCDATYVDKASITPALGHTWSAWVQIQAPTTDGYGIEKRTCSVCGTEELRTVAPIGDHVFTLQSEVKPGCETTGEKVWVCTAHTDCPANYTEIVPATGHDYQKTAETLVSCVVDGTETYTCSNCGDSYTLLTAPAIGHDYESEVTTEATCETDGVRTYTCQNDATHTYTEVIPKLGHDYVGVVTAPTCSTYGYTTYTCQNDASHVYVSDFVATVAHTYEKDDAQSVAATCTSKGYDVMVCTVCGDSYKVITDATGHDYDDGVVTTPATCTANGVKTYTCNNDATHTYTEVIPATGHTYGSGVVVREADAGNTGLVEYTCETCGDKFYEEYVVNSTVHTWNVEVKQNATCTEKGVAVYTCINPNCEVCSHGVTATFTKQTPALGHDYVGVVTIAPTCTETGVMTYTCSRCGDTYTEDIPATGHTYGAGEVTEATCTTAGYTKYTCTVCDYEMFDSYVAPLGHQMDSHIVTAPTCTTAGWTTHSCTRDGCTYSYIDTVTEATGHNYTFEITTEPTCETDGVKTYTCTQCTEDVDGHSYTETLPKTGHDWGEWVITTYPTAEAEGVKTRTCANDPTHTETVTLPKLGHTMVPGEITTEPTCTTTGIQVYVCTEHTGDAACGYTYEVVLPALGHEYDEGIVTTPATCTTDGVKTYTCTRCAEGTDGHSYTEVVPKTGHDMETTVTDATCVSDRFTTYTCKTCGYSYVINETGTALGHSFTEIVETVDATCEAKGYTIYKCERCDQTKTVTTDAIGHDWGEWTTTTPATCSERGVETRVCKNDPTHIQTRRTPTVDHEFVSTLVYPTCTDMGFTILACKGCGIAIRTDFVPAYGHSYDEGVYEEATCTTPGGIRYTCTNVNSEGTPCGYSYLVQDTEALGHDIGDWYFTEHPTVENAYAKRRDCQRGGCTYYEYECGKMENEDDVNVYYKVEYYNPWTTDEYTVLNYGVTKLARTYKTEKVEETYVLVGEEAVYPNEILPVREKDETWGAYQLIDWTYDEVGQTQSALDDLKSVTENMTVYALFEGYDVSYKVAFFNEDGSRLTREEVVLHGHSAQYPYDDPTMEDNVHYKFEFSHWDYDYTKIYEDIGIRAIYDKIEKEYTMVYCDWNGTELARETFKYGAPAQNAPENPTRPADATYIYEFSGKWQTQPGKEEYINLNSLTVPIGTAEGAEYKVYARYYQKARYYTVNVYGHGINGENIPGATVQILNSSGYLVTTAQLDSESKATFRLTYDSVYTAMVNTDVAVGEVQFVLNSDPTWPNNIDVNLKQYEDPDHNTTNCTCICHSFLGGLWINLLNLIYRFFGKKYVCCFDMYATHGDQLVYGQ